VKYYPMRQAVKPQCLENLGRVNIYKNFQMHKKDFENVFVEAATYYKGWLLENNDLDEENRTITVNEEKGDLDAVNDDDNGTENGADGDDQD
jgi:hypothetical protein